MLNTLYGAALCGSLALFAVPAVAASDTAPHDPNALPPQPYARYVSRCEVGTEPVTNGNNIFCDGVPAARFVQVSSVPAGYAGRVIVLTPYGSGYQELGW